MAELSPIVRELERMAGVIKQQFPRAFSRKDTPLVSVASRGTKVDADGWYIPPVWKDATEDTLAALAGLNGGEVPEVEKRDEVVIASEVLGDPKRAVAELARQLLVAEDNGKHVGAHLYYPRIWTHKAPLVGCTARQDPNRMGKGWYVWQPGSLFQPVLTAIDYSVFEVEREGVTRKHSGSRMRKWSCGCQTIRAAIRVRAVCEKPKCEQTFVFADHDKALVDSSWSADEQMKKATDRELRFNAQGRYAQWWNAVAPEAGCMYCRSAAYIACSAGDAPPFLTCGPHEPGKDPWHYNYSCSARPDHYQRYIDWATKVQGGN